MTLRIGQSAPNLNTRDHAGNPICLVDMVQKGPVVLFFYPRDFTPLCSLEATAYEREYTRLLGHGAQVVGVSTDAVDSHCRFAQEKELSYPLVSDVSRSIVSDYKVLRPFGLGVRRVTYVISTDCAICGVIHKELSAEAHVKGALAILEKLKGTTSTVGP